MIFAYRIIAYLSKEPSNAMTKIDDAKSGLIAGQGPDASAAVASAKAADAQAKQIQSTFSDRVSISSRIESGIASVEKAGGSIVSKSIQEVGDLANSVWQWFLAAAGMQQLERNEAERQQKAEDAKLADTLDERQFAINQAKIRETENAWAKAHAPKD
jgi:hypothetical protein